MKKPFGNTKVGSFLKKAAGIVPDIVEVGLGVALGQSPVAAIKDKLVQEAETNTEAATLLQEYKLQELQFEKEMLSIQAQDRASARDREVQVAKTGKFDFMHLATGVAGLGSFLFCLYAVVFIPSVENNKLFVHIIGMIEGVVIGNIFSYYYGTSKSSSDKNSTLKKVIEKFKP